jgi:hypothetical protein
MRADSSVGLAWLIFAITILIQGASAFANDTLIRMGAGGITFVKSEDIRMLEEYLYISQKKVKVKYRFLNESDKDIHTSVAFPMPSSEGRSGDTLEWAIKRLKTSFSVLVDGSPQSTTAYHDDTVVWQQTFPAGKETVVEHSYVPIPGGDIELWSDMRNEGLASRMMVGALRYAVGVIPSRGTGSDACLDKSVKRIIENRVTSLSAESDHVYVVERDVEYALGTGRNWKGPIGKFTLLVEKENPEDFISLCFPGKGTKISPTTLEFVQNDFVPPDKLVVYFYRVTVSP